MKIFARIRDWCGYQWSRCFRRLAKNCRPEWFERYLRRTFEADWEYGFSVPYHGSYEDATKIGRVKAFLRKDMEYFVPRDFREYVEYRALLPRDFWRKKAVAWYYLRGVTGKDRHTTECDGYVLI